MFEMHLGLGSIVTALGQNGCQFKLIKPVFTYNIYLAESSYLSLKVFFGLFILHAHYTQY